MKPDGTNLALAAERKISTRHYERLAIVYVRQLTKIWESPGLQAKGGWDFSDCSASWLWTTSV